MDTVFVEIRDYLKTALADGKAFASHFDIKKSSIELKPLSATNTALTIGDVEQLIASLLGEQGELGRLPLENATISTFTAAAANRKAGLPTRASIAIDFDGPVTWTMAPDFELALTAVSIDYYGGSWSGRAAGAVTTLGYEFTAVVSWPSLTITGTCEPASLPKPADLATAHGLAITTSAANPPSIDLLEVFASPRASALSLHAQVSNLITLGPLHLDSATLTIDYHGGPHAEFGGELSADITLGKVLFQLSATKSATGWKGKAHAATPPGKQAPTLQELVHAIGSTFDGSLYDLQAAGVPREVADTTISGDAVLLVDSAKKHVTLRVAVSLNKDAARLDFSIDMAPGTFTAKAGLHVNGMQFEIGFASTKTTTLLVGQFTSEAPLELKIRDLVEMLRLTPGQPAPTINATATISVSDVLLAMASTKTPTKTPPTTPTTPTTPTKAVASKPKFLVAADIDGGFDLSGLGDLPLVGALMPRDLSMRLSLAPVLVNQSWTTELKELNKLRGKGGPTLPSPLIKPALGVSLQMPGLSSPLDVGLELDQGATGDAVGVQPAPPSAAKGDGLIWKSLNKSLGPVSVERVGFALDRTKKSGPELRVLLDASLGLAGLEVSLIGLGAHYNIDTKEFGVELHGMALDLNKPPLRIAGGFAEIGHDYLGKLEITTKTVSVAAMGGFKMIHGTPSMFVYGVVNTPIGGPPFFFVEGLAAGFGYNRNLTAPALGKVHEFPFVHDAIKVAGGDSVDDQDKVDVQLARLHEFVAPELGEYFLAAGIKFTSFKLLESFILVILSAGSEFKLDAFGISTYQSPPIVPPSMPAMARIELEIAISVRPATGAVLVQAALAKDSYVYSPVVHLSGGFAFATWFSGPHAGDFVISAGGYHPDFHRPSHYPEVQRIGLAFKVPHFDVSIKGTAYFALTPSMLMAGGALEAHAKFGSVRASFRMWVDFLIQWEPYHYDAKTGVSIDAHWHCFSTSASASLHIWGPEFCGLAHVKWTVFSFDVAFGATRGSATPISWKKFQQSFLPHTSTGSKSKVTPTVDIAPTVSITAGLVTRLDVAGKTVHVVNPHELQMTVDTKAPFATFNDKAPTKKSKMEWDTLAGGPMGEYAEVARADLQLTFSRDASDFVATVGAKRYPAAMWGPASVANRPSAATVTSGGSLTLQIATPTQPTGETKIDRSAAAYDPHLDLAGAPAPSGFQFGPSSTKIAMAVSPAQRAASRKRRAFMLSAIGVDTTEVLHGQSLAPLLHERPTVMSEAP